MIIETRYRDIPAAEVDKVHAALSLDSIDWEKQMRGMPITIRTPALPDTDGCGGPWYRIASGPVKGAVFVCPHLAEIGD